MKKKMAENFEQLFLDLAKSLIPALVVSHYLNNSILMYYMPLMGLMFYVFKKMCSSIRLPWKKSSHNGGYIVTRDNFYHSVMHYLSNNEDINNFGEYFIPDASTKFNWNEDNIEDIKRSNNFKFALKTKTPIKILHNNEKYLSKDTLMKKKNTLICIW